MYFAHSRAATQSIPTRGILVTTYESKMHRRRNLVAAFVMGVLAVAVLGTAFFAYRNWYHKPVTPPSSSGMVPVVTGVSPIATSDDTQRWMLVPRVPFTPSQAVMISCS